MLEGWMVIAGWAGATTRARIGLMVGANTFRNPALVAKMATALDHICGGRAILGIGGAWFETEHTAFGIEFGGSPGERLRWLDEAARIMRGMLHGEQPSGEEFYATSGVRNDPPPVQAHLPLLIGGGGEKRTLRTVAQYADWCNFGGGFENVRHKDEVLRRHCDEVGRDQSEIDRTVGMGVWSSATTRPRRSASWTRPSATTGARGRGRTSPWARPSRWRSGCGRTWGSASGISSSASRRRTTLSPWSG